MKGIQSKAIGNRERGEKNGGNKNICYILAQVRKRLAGRIVTRNLVKKEILTLMKIGH